MILANWSRDDEAMGEIGSDQIGANDVRVVGRFSREILERAPECDWEVRAGAHDWDCRTTAAHIADALAFFGGHLAARSTQWLKFDLVPHANASNRHLARLIDAMAQVLAQVIEATPEDARAFHHSGMWDKSGFAAMASLESVVHTGDIAVGLGIEFDPPRDLCQRIVDRLFVGRSGDEDPWQLLWWGTGRGDLPGRERLGPGWETYWLKNPDPK